MPDDIKTVSLYEQDFSAWALAQADALRVSTMMQWCRSTSGVERDLPSVLRDTRLG